ncbi:MAG: N-acetylmuramoyl-L-alanine amidase [Chloroflexi bacterium]|nr:N-acetylmuramoyl-L-alanine amidase [Chloroflexota bacterium]
MLVGRAPQPAGLATPVPSLPPATPATTGQQAVGSPAPLPGRQPVVFIDPGHGGVDLGAVGLTPGGVEVSEKDAVLAIALRTAEHLRAAGIQAVLARTDDELPDARPEDFTQDGERLTGQGVLNDLQRRIDLANESGASLLLSIHLNAHDDPSQRGSETYYTAVRPFAAANRQLANLVQSSLIRVFRAEGYTTPDGGVLVDSELGSGEFGVLPDDYHHLVLLGPDVPGRLRASQMPGVLAEPLYLSNAEEARAAADPTMQDLIARAYASAIEEFLGTAVR